MVGADSNALRYRGRQEEVFMPARRRPPSRSPLNQAVKAGRRALRQAEKRIPPDLRRQIERGIKDGKKRIDPTVKDLRPRVSEPTAPHAIHPPLTRFTRICQPL